MPSVVFFGNEQLSSTRTPTKAPTLKMLIDEGYEIECLILKDSPQTSRKPRPQPIAHLAEVYDIPIKRVSNKQELLDAVINCKSELAVLVAFGMIIPQNIIENFRLGIVNIHPSLLPTYRGTTPIESAILDGAYETGVSLISLTSEMDAGPIYAYSAYSLNGNESKAVLTENLSELGASMLQAILPRIFKQELKPKPQDELKATYTKSLTKQDADIDWTKSAAAIEREIRALADWPGSKTTISKTDVTITQAKVVKRRLNTGEILIEDKALCIGCAEGSLQIIRLKPNGKAEMTVKEFINGYVKIGS